MSNVMNLAFTIPKFMGSIILTYTPWKTVMSSCVKTLGFNANKVKQGPFWIGTQTAKCRAKPGPRSRYGLRVKWSNDPAMLFFTLKCTFFYGLLVLQRPDQPNILVAEANLGSMVHRQIHGRDAGPSGWSDLRSLQVLLVLEGPQPS